MPLTKKDVEDLALLTSGEMRKQLLDTINSPELAPDSPIPNWRIIDILDKPELLDIVGAACRSGNAGLTHFMLEHPRLQPQFISNTLLDYALKTCSPEIISLIVHHPKFNIHLTRRDVQVDLFHKQPEVFFPLFRRQDYDTTVISNEIAHMDSEKAYPILERLLECAARDKSLVKEIGNTTILNELVDRIDPQAMPPLLERLLRLHDSISIDFPQSKRTQPMGFTIKDSLLVTMFTHSNPENIPSMLDQLYRIPDSGPTISIISHLSHNLRHIAPESRLPIIERLLECPFNTRLYVDRDTMESIRLTPEKASSLWDHPNLLFHDPRAHFGFAHDPAITHCALEASHFVTLARQLHFVSLDSRRHFINRPDGSIELMPQFADIIHGLKIRSTEDFQALYNQVKDVQGGDLLLSLALFKLRDLEPARLAPLIGLVSDLPSKCPDCKKLLGIHQDIIRDYLHRRFNEIDLSGSTAIDKERHLVDLAEILDTANKVGLYKEFRTYAEIFCLTVRHTEGERSPLIDFLNKTMPLAGLLGRVKPKTEHILQAVELIKRYVTMQRAFSFANLTTAAATLPRPSAGPSPEPRL